MRSELWDPTAEIPIERQEHELSLDDPYMSASLETTQDEEKVRWVEGKYAIRHLKVRYTHKLHINLDLWFLN